MAGKRGRVRMPSLYDLGLAAMEPRRFLFVVPPLTGHVNPTVAVARELVRRGHEVAWAGPADTVAPLLDPGSTLYPAQDEELTAALDAARARWLTLRGPAALRLLWEEVIVPLGHAMLPGVEAAVRDFRPDVVISDQQALAGPVAARRRNLPWVTSATTSAELTGPLADLPKVEEWVREQIAGFQRAHGLTDPLDLRFSDHLVLVFSTAALIGPTSRSSSEGLNLPTTEFPDHFAFVGPALGRPSGADFPWDFLAAETPAILVSLGTINGPAGERFFAEAAAAVADLDVRAVFVAPELADPPPNVLVRPCVPQLDLLPHLSAVVSHGGHNTVCETLAHGLPLVVAPIRGDQPVIARQVEAAGAGIAVRFSRVRAAELREAISRVLTADSYGRAARAVQRSFVRAGGAGTAADRLEKLL